MLRYDYLIVGAGLFGSVFAREMTDAGKRCLVIDRRPHIGGNIWCAQMEDICVHRYGAHIFHTGDEEVWQYVRRFVTFNDYVHAPMARCGDALFNLPFNMNTFSQLWGVRTPGEAQAKLAAQTEPYRDIEPANLEEQSLKLVGRDIYETLIRHYTQKQWGRPCTELPAFIIRRLPLRFTYDNNYFSHPHQGIPVEGYNALTQRLLEGSDLRLNTDYRDFIAHHPHIAEKTVYSGAIDEFFGYQLGALAYRTVRFEDEMLDAAYSQGCAVINYTGPEESFTRAIEHRYFLSAQPKKTVITREYPCEWQPGMEPFYPVNDARNQALYHRYAALARTRPDVIFGGRLGSYRYMDMDQTIRAALDAAALEKSR
ncbi:MAG: UDP-galactopyranose mutase [Clostridia bacterium]|nr:UDP-galactopyranose mutase [Clostridia bacterium]